MNTKGAEAEILIQCADCWMTSVALLDDSRLVYHRSTSRPDQEMMSAQKVENKLNEQKKASLLQVKIVT